MLSSAAFLAFVAVTSLSDVRLLKPLAGYLLLTVGSQTDIGSSTAFFVANGSVRPAPTPKLGTFRSIDWGRSPEEVLATACEGMVRREVRCHIERLTVDGELLQTYPKVPVAEFVEPDGRLTPGDMEGPARISSDGQLLALYANGRKPAFVAADTGQYISGMRVGHSEYAWSPTGHRLAYTRSPSGSDSVHDSQLFLLDFDSGSDRQLTYFPDKDHRRWWEFWLRPQMRPPLIAGLSWARRADVLLFFVIPDRGMYLWNPINAQLTELGNPKAKCWRRTQLSADAEQILYIAACRGPLSVLHQVDDVRVINVSSGDDQAVLSVGGDSTIVDADWWTE